MRQSESTFLLIALLLIALFAAVTFLPSSLLAQTGSEGTVKGTVSGKVQDQASRKPLAFANVVLISTSDSSVVRGANTDTEGRFLLTDVPPGEYAVECRFIGYATFRSERFTVDSADPRIDLKTIGMKESALALDEVLITSEKKLFDYSIDRKVYNVDQDMMSKSGSASDLLQNIPSVEVDINGNVSLRGSGDVLILVNGKASPVMRRSRAEVLQQMPATSIEKIEVITNPSARFTPEGTSGIINIVLRKDTRQGLNGSGTAHLGAIGRHNESFNLNYNPGDFNLFGNYGYRHDERSHVDTDTRQVVAPSPGSEAFYQDRNRFTFKPRAHIAGAGLNWRPSEKNTFELSGEYFSRRPDMGGTSTVITRDSEGSVLEDLDRIESGYEDESETRLTVAYEHNFPEEEHQLRIEANTANAPEVEHTDLTEVYRTPVRPTGLSRTHVESGENESQISLDYARPLNKDSKIEAGYAGELTGVDIDSRGEQFDDATQQFVRDTLRTYRFEADEAVHAFYGTAEHSFGDFGVMGGLRAEFASVESKLESENSTIDNDYTGIYPTLHLAYRLGEGKELQLNYSRRIRRPRPEDLNPFPESDDPRNLEAGNPHLKPENIHSIELGYHMQRKEFSFVPSIYYRYKYDGFTRITTAMDDSTTLRTVTNLSNDQSGGLEAIVGAAAGELVSANVNLNIFYEQIDASNIGFSSEKSIVSWSGTLNLNIKPLKSTTFQINSRYRSARLTPQGEARPSFSLNAGLRQDLFGERVSLTVAASDIFRTQRQDMTIDYADTRQHITGSPDSRIVYFGLTYYLGRIEKKSQDKPLQYEEDQQQ